MSKDGYVYLMTNTHDTVLYVGVTSDLLRRVAEHKLGRQPGFTKRYRCTKLVYVEAGDSIAAAIQREKQLKNWRRAWKDELVASLNPSWADLAPSIGLTADVMAELARDPGVRRDDGGGGRDDGGGGRDDGRTVRDDGGGGRDGGWAGRNEGCAWVRSRRSPG